jgi:hypothetical protein
MTSLDASFESLFSSFTATTRTYSATQRKQILSLASNALQHIFASMPAPRREGDEVPSGGLTSPQKKRQIGEVEALVSDRMLQQGLDKSHFIRYDPKSTGIVTFAQFRASVSAIGKRDRTAHSSRMHAHHSGDPSWPVQCVYGR